MYVDIDTMPVIIAAATRFLEEIVSSTLSPTNTDEGEYFGFNDVGSSSSRSSSSSSSSSNVIETTTVGYHHDEVEEEGLNEVRFV
jgi:hypothetical protein